jgi:hypothetical protein
MPKINGLPDTFDSMQFCIELGGEPWNLVVSFSDGTAFNSMENPFDCLTVGQMKHLIGKLTEVVDTVENMTENDS